MKRIDVIKKIFTIVFICLMGVSATVFAALYIESCGIDLITENSALFTAIAVVLSIVLTVLTVVFYADDKKFLCKIFILAVALYFAIILVLYLFRISGLSDKINSVESFRDYIASFGASAVLLFILIQFLQVAVLPIPAFITTGAGVLLFGPLYAAIYSFIGIFLGSLVAFFIGKVFGVKVASWLVGKEELDKWIYKIRGKDRIVLTVMFLFPFFPDDVLCFVAGITSMSPLYFTVMIFITRVISVVSTCYSLNNSFIPYTTWWGILIWAVLIVGVLFICFMVYKHSDKIEKLFKRKSKKKPDKNK